MPTGKTVTSSIRIEPTVKGTVRVAAERALRYFANMVGMVI